TAQIGCLTFKRTSPHRTRMEVSRFDPGIFGAMFDRLVCISMVLIQSPLHHVAQYIVKSPWVGLQFTYFMKSTPTIVKIPGIFLEFFLLLAEKIRSGTA